MYALNHYQIKVPN